MHASGKLRRYRVLAVEGFHLQNSNFSIYPKGNLPTFSLTAFLSIAFPQLTSMKASIHVISIGGIGVRGFSKD